MTIQLSRITLDPAVELARHEAAHAVVRIALDLPVWAVAIDPANGSGECRPTPETAQIPASKLKSFAEKISCALDEEEVQRFTKQIIVLAAGGIAQRWYNPHARIEGCADDEAMIRVYASLIHKNPSEASALARRCRVRARDLVWLYHGQIVAIAETLAKRFELSGAEVRTIFYADEHCST